MIRHTDLFDAWPDELESTRYAFARGIARHLLRRRVDVPLVRDLLADHDPLGDGCPIGRRLADVVIEDAARRI